MLLNQRNLRILRNGGKSSTKKHLGDKNRKPTKVRNRKPTKVKLLMNNEIISIESNIY